MISLRSWINFRKKLKNLNLFSKSWYNIFINKNNEQKNKNRETNTIYIYLQFYMESETGWSRVRGY